MKILYTLSLLLSSISLISASLDVAASADLADAQSTMVPHPTFHSKLAINLPTPFKLTTTTEEKPITKFIVPGTTKKMVDDFIESPTSSNDPGALTTIDLTKLNQLPPNSPAYQTSLNGKLSTQFTNAELAEIGRVSKAHGGVLNLGQTQQIVDNMRLKQKVTQQTQDMQILQSQLSAQTCSPDDVLAGMSQHAKLQLIAQLVNESELPSVLVQLIQTAIQSATQSSAADSFANVSGVSSVSSDSPESRGVGNVGKNASQFSANDLPKLKKAKSSPARPNSKIIVAPVVLKKH